MRLLLISLIFLVGCTSSKELVKRSQSGKDIHELVASKSFKIVSDWANPMANSQMLSINFLPNGSSPFAITLVGNNNFLIQEGDSVRAILPFYGEQRFAKAYTDNAGIEMNGIPENYKLNFDEKKKEYKIHFKMKDKSEVYNVKIRMYQNLTTKIYVSSSHRSSITYSGRVKDYVTE